jgi:hypothetical protein
MLNHVLTICCDVPGCDELLAHPLGIEELAAIRNARRAGEDVHALLLPPGWLYAPHTGHRCAGCVAKRSPVRWGQQSAAALN